MLPWSIYQNDQGPIVLIVTSELLHAPELQRLTDMLDTAALQDQLLIVNWDARYPFSFGGEETVIGVSEGPASDNQWLSRILNWIVEREGAPTRDRWRNEVTPAMLERIEDLPLSKRAINFFYHQNMVHVGDLVQHTEAELLRAPRFGRVALREVKAALAALDLRLGMELDGWPPADFDAMQRRLATAARVSRLEQARGGATFEPRNDHFAMVASGDLDDLSVALNPLTRQMQSVLLEKARNFAAMAARLENQPGWTGIGRSPATLAELLNRAPEGLPDVLGFLYPTALELGSFLEMDQQLTADQVSYAAPLDPEMRRPLQDLVRNLAPWLRAFPSVRELDDDASRFLIKATELPPTFELVHAAHEHTLLTEDDLNVFRQLQAAADRGAFQGEKAAGRAKRSASNLVIGMAAFAGTFFSSAVSSDYATSSPLVHKVGQFLTTAEVQISALLADLPSDLQYAILSFLKELHGTGPAGAQPFTLPDGQRVVGESGARTRRERGRR